MKILSVGTNEKLGPRTASLSRPVGPTCPASCPFLGAGCYAEKIQNRYPSVKKGWSKAYGLTTEQWKAWSRALCTEIVQSTRRVDVIRLHVGGDWVGPTGAVDRSYLTALCRAVKGARAQGCETPVFYYTHAWREMTRFRPMLEWLGIRGYASVHGPGDAAAATAAGWRLAIDPGEDLKVGGKVAQKSGFREIYGVRALSCPEQIKGHKKMTCDRCTYCYNRHDNVIFYRH